MKKAKEHFDKAGRRVFNDSRSELDVFEKTDILRKFSYVPKVVAFVPAKGKSSRVKSKNVRLLGDKPLFLHILDTLLSCVNIDEVYLDTESDEVFSLANGRKHIELRRPVELASNKTNGNQLLLYEASQVQNANIYVQALPTAPFLSKTTIERAVYELVRSQNNDSLFGVSKQRLYLWNSKGEPINYNPANIPNSFDLEDTIIETMSLYVIKKNALLRTQSRIGTNPILFPIPLLQSIDINTEEDFNLAKIICSGLSGGK